MNPANITTTTNASKPTDSLALPKNATDETPNTATGTWGPREVKISALALGGLAFAAYRNHDAECSMLRSILSYATWQLPALVYYLGTKPMSFAEPAMSTATRLHDMAKEQLGIPSEKGICGAICAAWLASPKTFKENPKAIHALDIFESDKLKELITRFYPNYQDNDFKMEVQELNAFLSTHHIHSLDHFLLPTVYFQQMSNLPDIPGSREEIQKALLHTWITVWKIEHRDSVHSIDYLPLKHLEVGDDLICLMVADEQHHYKSHMINLSKTANGFVIFDPEARITLTMTTADECRSLLERLEQFHNKKLYHFARYRRANPESLATSKSD